MGARAERQVCAGWSREGLGKQVRECEPCGALAEQACGAGGSPGYWWQRRRVGPPGPAQGWLAFGRLSYILLHECVHFLLSMHSTLTVPGTQGQPSPKQAADLWRAENQGTAQEHSGRAKMADRGRLRWEKDSGPGWLKGEPCCQSPGSRPHFWAPPSWAPPWLHLI